MTTNFLGLPTFQFFDYCLTIGIILKISRLVVSVTVFFGVISFSSMVFSDETPTRLSFVKGLGINANFGQMMRFGGSQTQTYRNIVCILGTIDAKQLMEQELVPVNTKYQPQ